MRMHERETHAPRQRRGGLQLERAFDSSAVAWCYGVSRHAVCTRPARQFNEEGL
jgi:hypothetical protein